MSQLSPLDLAFVLFESRDTPLHVTGLIELTPPANQPDFARDLYAELLSHTTIRPPFNYRLQLSLTRFPRWRQTSDVDLARHVHLISLPSPGNREQLLDLVSRLHSEVLRHDRPLWEMCIIDGLEQNKIAICLKVHHALADGMRLGAMFKACSSASAEEPCVPFWASAQFVRSDAEKLAQEKQLFDQMFGSAEQVQRQLSNALGLFSIGSGILANLLKGDEPELKLPFTAPNSPFNQPHKRARSVALSELPLATLRRISKLTGATLNDTVLTVCDMALHRYLAEQQIELQQPLVGLMPINLRNGDQATSTGNKFAAGLVEMGCCDAPPAQRLAAIQRSTQSVKHQAQFVSPGGYYNFSLAINALELLSGKLKLNQVIRPAANLILSNVPGPSTERFFFGARIDAVYPLSLLVPGQTLNITMYSYEDRLLFGLVCCRAGLPQAEAITDYLAPALADLEQDVMRLASQGISDELEPKKNLYEEERDVLLAEASALVEELKRLKVSPLPRQTA